MKRKGAYSGQLLALDGTYELAARPDVVKVDDVSEGLWDSAHFCAIIHKAKGKHVNALGVRSAGLPALRDDLQKLAKPDGMAGAVDSDKMSGVWNRDGAGLEPPPLPANANPLGAIALQPEVYIRLA